MSRVLSFFYSSLLSLLVLLPISTISSVVHAEILVLVHGFNSNGSTWYQHGIIKALQDQGWQDGGSLVSSPHSGIYHHGPKNLMKYRTITVDLPSEAPLELQTQVLKNYFNYLHSQEPEQTFSIIAHSAGGVVSRMLLVANPHFKVHRLVTIASPHLGSGMAEVGEFVAKTPASIMGNVVGADNLDNAEILLNQLQREQPNTLLFWLNRQLHPNIEYVSIVRSAGTFFNHDIFVRSYSQDMRNISGIKHAISIPSYGEHELQYRDGILIAAIVNSAPEKHE